MALNKLRSDGYIDFIRIAGNVGQFVEDHQAGEGMSIRRNFNGHLFLAAGGYVGEAKKIKEKETTEIAYNARMETYSSRLANWTERLTYATIVAAVGAFGLLVWEMRHLFSCLF